MATLDELSLPQLDFPHDFLQFVRAGIQNGTTVNGVRADEWAMSPKNDSERW